ncbi:MULTISPECIES: DUF3613 domain-containing protein [Halomonas]|uniref:DUF3613 domain-containing protein n=1 Tax=Halomonas TaxID=2745 RepID=UPI001C94B350|nr:MULTISPECIES: DUF3613 domain-containing protein [Halomonas]MBY6209783.1 DUF3613 domain-containing protein [Halomonas sp. DP3Y7-2]MBY6230002.1 DUF3613 domain-containing protein [Halomonas sp. DP3Y7-1]MCA0918184.1 DUF3613 domain-containing protein [Halomonas denitrificans]
MMSRRRMRSCKERWTVMCKDIVTQPKTLIVAAMVCLLLSLALMLWPDRAEAQQTATSHPGIVRLSASRDPFGERTRGMLAAQREGRVASPSVQVLSGKVQSQIYQRYVDSFGHPIPERYIETGFGED